MHWLEKYNTPQNILVSGSILFCLYAGLIYFTMNILHAYQAPFKDFIYNLNLFYTPDTLYRSLHTIPSSLVYLYPWVAMIDIFVALSYAIFGLLLSFTIIQVVTHNKYCLLIPYVFICAAFFNVIEDGLLSIIFITFPHELPLLVSIANLLTSTKLFLLVTGIYVSLIFLLILIKIYFNNKISFNSSTKCAKK